MERFCIQVRIRQKIDKFLLSEAQGMIPAGLFFRAAEMDWRLVMEERRMDRRGFDGNGIGLSRGNRIRREPKAPQSI